MMTNDFISYEKCKSESYRSLYIHSGVEQVVFKAGERWHSSFKSVNYVERYYILLLVVLKIYVALAIFQPYSDLAAGDNQSLKS